MAQDRLSPENLYEQARSAGLSHGTAAEVSNPRDLVRTRLSGLWPAHVPETPTRARYSTEPLQNDAGLWLRKLACSLSVRTSNPASRQIAYLFGSQGKPLITNYRVDISRKDEGYVNLDLELREQNGRRRHTSIRIPVATCNAHDSEWVIGAIVEHLTGSRISAIFAGNLILNETDLRHVAG